MSRHRQTGHHLPTRVYFKDGRYRYLDPAGKWHTLGREWDRTAREKHDALSRGAAPPQTVSALLDAFLIHREDQVRARDASKRTLADNEQEAKMLRIVFGYMPASTVKRQHVARYLRERTDREGKPASVRANREAALLSSAYAWAMGLREWDLNENPCYGVRRNRERPRRRYIETRELAAWKRYAPKWLRAYVLLKRLTGARQGELLTLTLPDVTERGVSFGISKTGRVKIVRMSWALDVAVQTIKSLHNPKKATPIDQPLFRSRTGHAMTAQGLKSAWARAMGAYIEAGGTSFREHDLRAKTASDLSTSRAQELLDHSNPATTRRVYQRAPAKVRPLR